MKAKFSNLRSLALIILTGLILSSCSKKDNTAASDNIIGTWTAGNYTFTAKVGDLTLEQYFTTVAGLSEAEAAQYTALFNLLFQSQFSGTIQIKSDGTYTSNIGGTTDSGTWSLSSDGKELTITPTGEDPMTIDILALTANTLHVQMTQTIEEDLNGDEVNETVTLNIDITFTK
jgi:hypothetical protein